MIVSSMWFPINVIVIYSSKWALADSEKCKLTIIILTALKCNLKISSMLPFVSAS